MMLGSSASASAAKQEIAIATIAHFSKFFRLADKSLPSAVRVQSGQDRRRARGSDAARHAGIDFLSRGDAREDR